MIKTSINGVFKDNGRLFTENLPDCKGLKVYDEKLIVYNNREYRSWNPYKSKLAAAILNGLKEINLFEGANVLYLGAATGTTVSHISDIIRDPGVIYAVEISPYAIKQLSRVCENRKNIIPILADANRLEEYENIVSKPVDLVYQDISQRNQTEIFIKNVKKFLDEKGQGILMIKARSIDVSDKPERIYGSVVKKLREVDLKVKYKIDLSPYAKDHVAIVVNL